MVFQNIDFHNVEEIQKEEKGYRLYRFPLAVAEQMDEGANRVSCMSTGIELRFKIKGEAVDRSMAAGRGSRGSTSCVYLLRKFSGWMV